jgi:hypothetical protein
MALRNRAWRWRGTLAPVFLAVSILAASAASAETPDLFTVSGVKIAASAESTTTARDLAMAQGRSLAWSELLLRFTAEDQTGTLPKLTDNELSHLISSFEVRNERRNSKRYLAEATFHFSQTEVSNLLHGSKVVLAEPSGSLRMIRLTAGKTGLLNRLTGINELKSLSSINYGMRVFLTTDVRFDSLEDWVKIRTQSALVQEIADMDVIGLSKHAAEIELTYFGPIEDLPKAMARQNLKLSNSAGQYTLELGPLASAANDPAEMPAGPLSRP